MKKLKYGKDGDCAHFRLDSEIIDGVKDVLELKGMLHDKKLVSYVQVVHLTLSAFCILLTIKIQEPFREVLKWNEILVPL